MNNVYAYQPLSEYLQSDSRNVQNEPQNEQIESILETHSEKINNINQSKQDLTYLNDNFLVYTKNYTDTATNTPVEEEFRFISTK